MVDGGGVKVGRGGLDQAEVGVGNEFDGTSAIPEMGYVGASAGEVFQRKRKRKVFACSIWADRSV